MYRTASVGNVPNVRRASSPPGMGSSRTSFREFADGTSDIAAAMTAVKKVMKSKTATMDSDGFDRRRSTGGVLRERESMEEAAKRQAIEREAEEQQAREAALQAREAEKQAKRAAEQRKSEKALRSAMDSGNMTALQRAINDAVAVAVPQSVISEARTLLGLETRLQIAVSQANLDDIRKILVEVERGMAIAAFPQEPPFRMRQHLQYWSEKKDSWVDCYVTDVSRDNKIQVSLKKKAGHWFSYADQYDRFRVKDFDLAAAAPRVCLADARPLLEKADLLQAALETEDVDQINAALARAGDEMALAGLINTAEAFVREATRARAEEEAARRSHVAKAWTDAKQNIRAALRAEADRACTEADERGWGNLERDLVIERLNAHEEALHGTDFAGLQAAIDKLEAEDFEVPPEIVQEARAALDLIKEQHEELRTAIVEGDAATIRAGIELSKEHFLPDDLVSEATAALQVIVSLDTAIKARDASVLGNTLLQAERAFPNLPLTLRARTILDVTLKLQKELRRGNMDAVRDGLAQVEEHCLPEPLVAKAKLALALDAAIKSKDPAALASALSSAERDCGDLWVVQQARNILRAHEALQDALQSGDIAAIEEAIRMAEAEGLSADMALMQRAHGLVKSAAPLQEAMQQAADASSLEEAILAAEAQGIPPALLAKARKQLAELKAQEALEKMELLMQGADLGSIEEAIRAAEALGVPASTLAKARQELAEKRAMMDAAALQEAIDRGDEAALQEAMRVAGAQGVPAALLEEAQRKLVEIRKQAAAEAVRATMQGNDVASIEAAIRAAEASGVPAEVVAAFRRELEEAKERKEEARRLELAEQRKAEFLARMHAVVTQGTDVLTMRQIIAEGEGDLGLESELDPVRQALEEELARRKEKALAKRAAAEKLAAEFKSMKEAHELGGSVLAADWKAAATLVAKPFVFSEEEEEED